jgi:carotenoid cleavage dioxygenase-like enzyme
MSGNGPIGLNRWTLDPAAGRVARRQLDDQLQEFPRVDEWVLSRPHRYGYSAVIGEVNQVLIPLSGDVADQAFANALLKHDLTRGTTQAHEFGRDATAGEAVFVPASTTAAEDDGYVMAFVHNPDRGAADLVVFGRTGLQRRTGRPGPPARPDPAWLPRQLDP